MSAAYIVSFLLNTFRDPENQVIFKTCTSVFYIWRSSKTEYFLLYFFAQLSAVVHFLFSSELMTGYITSFSRHRNTLNSSSCTIHPAIMDLTLLPMQDQNISHAILHENNIIKNTLQSRCVCQSSRHSSI